MRKLDGGHNETLLLSFVNLFHWESRSLRRQRGSSSLRSHTLQRLGPILLLLLPPTEHGHTEGRVVRHHLALEAPSDEIGFHQWFAQHRERALILIQ